MEILEMFKSKRYERKNTNVRDKLFKFGKIKPEWKNKPLRGIRKSAIPRVVMNWIVYQSPEHAKCKVYVKLTENRNSGTQLVGEIRFKKWAGNFITVCKTRTDVLPIENEMYEWPVGLTYEKLTKNLTAFKINASIECADALNSFNKDLVNREMDDLNKAIQLDLPKFDETTVETKVETSLPKSATEIYHSRSENEKLDTPQQTPTVEETPLPDLDKELLGLCE